jgi:adenylate cyclase
VYRFQSGWWLFFFYNGIPVLSNAIILAVSNFVIGGLLYDKHSFNLFRKTILENPFNNFLTNILPFPLVIALVFVLTIPAFRIFKLPKTDPRFELGLRRLVNAPFYIGFWSFCGWILGNALARLVYAMEGVPQPAIIVFRVVGISLTSGLLNFVMTYYMLTLINRRFYFPRFFPEGGLREIPGVMPFSLRFNLEIFVLAVATGPILILGLSLLNIQGLVPNDERPSYVISIGLIIGLILLGMFFSALLARSLRKPLGRMRNAAEAIERGDYSVKVPVDTTDEVGDLALRINEMAISLAEKEKIKESFGRAVDPRVRDYLLERGGEMGGVEVEATILFSDIRGFTSFSESHSAPEVVEWLNTYFERMAECVREHGGIVNKYVGDAILAVFNAPLPLANHTQAAVDCAFRMLEKLDELNHELREKSIPEIKIGIGLHTGSVVAGNIGSRDRQEFTVIGDAVNTASRIESLCKKFQAALLVSEAVFTVAGENPALRKLGLARVKGKTGELTIYGIKPG